ncbi:hypothetical protein DACRYDRAFT_97473 [Dacryopinax primogenitus]|uniref:Fe2OG dioxygenase domain-containing protein n=1 Tax=Dacryopinax primogenitus (strain DJM 731) TaxID=1858805 RepID=M5FP65_DACPD|nr:uncharacterized protein DACRYDRAFT_97473 [Dacryopinax primogenitus]EJT96843.1 hypothetical protein DACRYDRAFT_97473 [Dacryopinax primogenitus]
MPPPEEPIRPSSPPDTTSARYRHQLRQHLRTLQPRASAHSAFREKEKKFKTRFPPPVDDVRGALDSALLEEERKGEVSRGWWIGSRGEGEVREISLQGGKGKGYVVPSVPGLVILPSFLAQGEQRALVRCCLEQAARAPNETNLDTHYLVPSAGIWAAREEVVQPRATSAISDAAEEASEQAGKGRRTLISNPPASESSFSTLLVTKPTAAPSPNLSPAPASGLIHKLRWASLGASYHWTSKTYDLSHPAPPVPPLIADCCTRVVRSVPWEQVYIPSDGEPEGSAPGWQGWKDDYTPDAGIVNFYSLSDTLMAHIDHSELDATRPLVSLSLGHACVFLIGGPTRETEPRAVLLRSGDALLMSGPCRRWYHGVPRVLEGTLPKWMWDDLGDEDQEGWKEFAEYLADKRINVNVRQVCPPGVSLPAPERD